MKKAAMAIGLVLAGATALLVMNKNARASVGGEVPDGMAITDPGLQMGYIQAINNPTNTPDSTLFNLAASLQQSGYTREAAAIERIRLDPSRQQV